MTKLRFFTFFLNLLFSERFHMESLDFVAHIEAGFMVTGVERLQTLLGDLGYKYEIKPYPVERAYLVHIDGVRGLKRARQIAETIASRTRLYLQDEDYVNDEKHHYYHAAIYRDYKNP